ncbi:hypothetical protein E4U43_005223 [Claviceps pusilla]|uniref:N-alkane-inducible cytochrome P450 n=1 Tax=Claviceps pusilla TaxID=123648 RepID=A0A9P7N2W8_9HYPO|nr:hypothetical protein E4U43_005223 [Claviceps pusilla]
MSNHLLLVPLIVCLSAVLLIRSLVVQYRRRVRRRRLGCQPPRKYPHRLPWLLDPWGRDLQRRRLEGFARGRYNRLFLEQFLRCGPTFEERSPSGTLLCTTDSDNWRTILALKADDYCKEETRSGPMLRFTGLGILTNEGAAWRRSRDLIKPLFVRAELGDVVRFKRHVDRLMEVLPRDGRTVDLMPWMAKLFLDSGTEFVFGQSFNCLTGDSTQAEEMLSAFRACRKSLGKKRILDSSSLPLFRDTEFERNVEIVHGFIDRQVARALDQSRRRTSADQAETTLDKDDDKHDDKHDDRNDVRNDDRNDDERARQHYVLLDELAKAVRDPIVLRHETLHVFMPSFLSISNIFSSVLFHLVRRPDIWAQLRREVLSLGDEPLTFERIKSLHSFRNVFFEGVRVHGSSGRLSRTAVRDTVIPRGGGPDGTSPVLVPKGRRVMLDMYSKLHDPRVWGDDADVFRPSRFEGRRLAWDFVAFSGGPRICPAQQQCITQSIYLLVRLVREFPVMENRDPCLEFVEAASLVSESRNGVLVGLGETPEKAVLV